MMKSIIFYQFKLLGCVMIYRGAIAKVLNSNFIFAPHFILKKFTWTLLVKGEFELVGE
jgi:hypothetical protein